MRRINPNPSDEHHPLALFEARCRRIFQLACYYGSKHALLLERDRPTPESFRRACHQGFAEAQMLILNELLEVQDSRKDLETKVKIARQARDRLAISDLKREIGIDNLKEHILRKLADSIAWHLIGGQSYIARRLCIREPSRPTLRESNLASVASLAAHLNASSPLEFALMSDLTSFVQVGDILQLTSKGIRIIEVKQGAKNHEAMSVISEFSLDQEQDERVDEILDNHPLKDQINRMLRQQRKADQATTVINTGIGNDPATGTKVNIPDVFHAEEHYYEELQSLLAQLGPSKDWAFTAIKGGLYIGAYKGVWQRLGRYALLGSAFEDIDQSYPVTDLRDGLAQALVEPVFVKPLSEDQIFDIVFGRVSVLLLLRVDEMIHLYSGTDVRAEFLSVKQSRKVQGREPRHRLLMHNGQSLKVVYPTGQEIIAGDGFYTRIVFDSLTPQCVVSMSVNAFKVDV